MFESTPAPVRSASLLGAAPAVPNVYAYLGEFGRHPFLPATVPRPCWVQRLTLRAFRAQEYPWTNSEFRACVKAGACPSFEPAMKESTVPGTRPNDYVAVPFSVAEASCRAHGGELLTNAQRAALAEGGEPRMAWEAFEADVLTRCPSLPRKCEPYVTASRAPASRDDEVPETRGPFGHRGLFLRGEWVRYYDRSYSWNPQRCSGSEVESGEYEPGFGPVNLQQVYEGAVPFAGSGARAREQGDSGGVLRGHFRCAFRGEP